MKDSGIVVTWNIVVWDSDIGSILDALDRPARGLNLDQQMSLLFPGVNTEEIAPPPLRPSEITQRLSKVFNCATFYWWWFEGLWEYALYDGGTEIDNFCIPGTDWVGQTEPLVTSMTARQEKLEVLSKHFLALDIGRVDRFFELAFANDFSEYEFSELLDALGLEQIASGYSHRSAAISDPSLLKGRVLLNNLSSFPGVEEFEAS